MLWAAAPHIGWHIANIQVLAALFYKKNEVTSRDSLGWVLLLDYLIYVTLPIRLRYCIILSVGTCASYIAALIGLAKSDVNFYQQVRNLSNNSLPFIFNFLLQNEEKIILYKNSGVHIQSLHSTSSLYDVCGLKLELREETL